MSKEDLTCKVSSVCKHKERKPKKPHYIPRPWGKPYNYKCFQCPFTCMEKSHLYNHMKYSLCKNSLSLLIESDWPYKKGNLLHPEQLRPLQKGPRLRGANRDEAEPLSGPEDRSKSERSEVTFAREAQEEAEEHSDRETGNRERAEEDSATKETPGETDSPVRGSTKRCKQPETDFVITDVFSLEDQLLKARSVEVEAKLKHYKLSKTCLTGPSLLSEQWRLLATSHRKAKSESAPPNIGSIPCYPPPPSFTDCQDPPGLNLSVLGVSYPLSPGLFSYVNPAVPGAAPAHAQLTQLPFLTSAAQLMHPGSSSLPHTDRALLPPRFYYPLLCEHAFGAAQVDASKGVKSSLSPPANLDPKSPPSYPPKINLWKVPALRPSPMAPSAAWASHQHMTVSPEVSYRAVEEKLQASAKEAKNSWGLKSALDVPQVREQGSKRTGAPLEPHEGPSEKKPPLGYSPDVLKNMRTTPPISIATNKLLHASSFRTAQQQSRSLEDWHTDVMKSPPESLDSEVSPALKPGKVAERASCPEGDGNKLGERDPESAAVLLSDLSKALQEYQDAERKISHLVKEDIPGQHHLWEHLCKIRSELSHIHQALEKTARQNEGPLDLSVKRDLGATGDGGIQCTGEVIKGGVTGETEEEEEIEEEEEEEEEEGSETEGKTASLESRKQSLDILIKMNRTGLSEPSIGAMVKAEVLSPSALGLRPTPQEALWPSRTTKCEADSSVLLCPDGRPLVFTDFTPSAKNLKRPSSREHLGETLCPPSPLTATDS
ncbi:proline-rich protein 35 [Megalops cyprinoides]|uniref:proline-rich protein 35 n=1 Tax=Megalops cyprinoides TaxID=118141 RepID=UPI0018654467|nr:proline-rich protein 35 [Megalops cyprinoides]